MADFVPIDHNPFDDADAGAMAPETYVNPGIKAMIDHIAGGVKQFVGTPAAVMTPNPYPAGSEEGIEFERTRQQAIQDAAPQMASMVTLGAGAVPAEANALRMGIKAYHGSPHDFDAFSLDKIGTGEGAQAYGHGLYFAENPTVAQEYRNTLADWKIDGKPVDPSNPSHLAAVTLKAYNGDLATAIYDLQSTARGGPVSERQAASDAVNLLKNKADIPSAVQGGHMYEVNINADPEHFLDWDKPLNQQDLPGLDQIRQNAAKSFPDLKGRDNPYVTGQGLIQAYRQHRGGNQQAVTEALRQAGIPGIKYLDQGSRASGEGSRNYVVFDDKLIDILRKYGIAGLPSAAAAASAMQQPSNADMVKAIRGQGG